jgi:hypothetical protein
MSVFEIPLKAHPLKIGVGLPGGVFYFRLIFCDAPQGGWLLDISDINGEVVAAGIPLVTGADLLEQYASIGLGCRMYCSTDGALWQPPQIDTLGVTSHLWVEF